MNKNTYLARCAPIAIAAMAALPAASAFAQEPAAQTPVIVLPEPTMTTIAPAPAPVIIDLPAPSPVTMDEPAVTTTRIAPASEVEAESAPAPAVRSIPRRETRAAVSGAPRDAAPASEEFERSSASIEPTMTETVQVEAAAPIPAPAEPAVAPIEDNSSEALLLGMLVALSIGGIGFVALRSRRRRTVEPELIDRPVVSRTPERAAPVTAREARIERNAPTAPHASQGYVAPAVSSGAVALPSELPESYEERDRLLRDMIAAKPDRANPFRSRGARAKRARLILQSLGRDFEKRKPRIDLSEYANVWPALRGWQPATA